MHSSWLRGRFGPSQKLSDVQMSHQILISTTKHQAPGTPLVFKSQTGQSVLLVSLNQPGVLSKRSAQLPR